MPKLRGSKGVGYSCHITAGTHTHTSTGTQLQNARFQNTYLNYLKGLNAANTFTWLTSSPDADTIWTEQLLKLTRGTVTTHTDVINFETDERGKLDEDDLLPLPAYNGLLIADIPHIKQLAGKQPDGEVELIAIYPVMMC